MKQSDGSSRSLSDREKDDNVSVLGVGSRLTSGPAAELVQTAFARELADQLALFKGMSFADMAHTVMLIEVGVIPPAEGAALLSALLALHEFPPDFNPTPELGDLYTNREAWLASRTAAVGWLGAGRARRESTTTGYRITVRSNVLAFVSALIKCSSVLVERANEYRSALMADYTYLQPAQPTTFGHYLLGFAYPLLRDLERLQGLYNRTNQSPAGCGSVNGSRLPQNRKRLADLLGFDGLAQHARDAMWQPDSPIETISAVVSALVNMDRLAEDLQIFATAEFDLVELAEGYTRASVIMPQKKNPYALAYIRGATNELIGIQANVAALGRTPSGQVDNRIFIYGDVPRALEMATGVAELMRGVLAGISFHSSVAAARLENGFTTATDLAETITLETGLDFRTAHRIVGRLVREATQTNRTMRELTTADLDIAAQAILNRPLHLSETAFTHATDPATAIAARGGIGGAAPEPLSDMFSECRSMLDSYSSWYNNATTKTAAAEEALIQTVQQLCGGA